MPEGPLDAVALFVVALVPADREDPVGAWRDDGADAALLEIVADEIGVVALVGEQRFGCPLGQFDQDRVRLTVRRLSGGEVEAERNAAGVTDTVNFTGEPAPRLAKSLFTSPPFAPAAETWPRTVVLSMLWCLSSAIAWANVVAMASHTPVWLQRRKRW